MAELGIQGPVRRGPAARSRSVRLHLALLALLAVLPAWGLAGVAAWRFAEAERAGLVRAGQATAQEIAAFVERDVAALRASLATLAASPGPLPAEGGASAIARRVAPPHAAAGVELRLEAPPAQPPSSGRNAGAPGIADGGAAWRPEEPGLVVSPLHRDPETGRLVITFRQPVVAQEAEGRPASLVLSTDALAFWSAILERARLPPGWVASVLDGNRAILARTPEPAGFLGQPVHPDVLAALEADGGAAGWREGTTRDGKPVYVAWQTLSGLPWTVLVGVPQEAVDGALRQAVLPVAAVGVAVLLGLTLGAVLWASRRLARPLRALEAAATAIGRGETPPPPSASGVREIDAAGAALAAAAAERREREAEGAALAARLQSVLESTTDCVLVLDHGWRITYLNSRARALLARGRELLGRRLADSLPRTAASAFEASFRQAFDTGMPVSVTAALGPEGPWFAADAFPSPEGLTVFFRDVSAARRAERALREGEARLQAVLDHVPVGVLMAEAPGGRVILANRRAAEFLDVPEIRADSVADFAARHPAFDATGAVVPPADQPLARALAGQEVAGAEYRYRRGDGRGLWVRSRAAPIRDANGQVTHAVAVMMDTDAERQAAEALRESELRFRTLAEAVPQIVWSSGPDGTVDYLNPRFFEFTGVPPQDAPAVLRRMPIHPEDRPAVRAAWRAALAAGTPYEAEFRMRRADGVWRWFVVRGLPARGADGAIQRWIGSATDVTDLVETRQALERQVAAEAAARQATLAAAEALAASETRFRRFAEASPDALWILDVAADRLDYVSPAFEQIWGAPPAGEGHAALAAGVAEEDRPRVEAALRSMLEGGEAIDLEYRIRRPDGQALWVRVLGFPLRDAVDRPGLFGGFVRDVTTRKEAERRQRLLIAELNHRVKNTLATVLSLARQTARRTGGPPGQGDSATAAFLADLQARLMALARGHDLLTATTWRGAMLGEVAAAALSPWRGRDEASARAARISLGGPPVWLAPRQALGLALAIHEMATNAAKHGALGAPQGQVALTWQPGPDGLVELDWTESGGPPARAPEREGFGTRLLRSGLRTELGPGSSVTLDYTQAGFRAKIRFRPAPEGDTQ